MITQEEIYRRVILTLVEALNVEEEDIHLHSTLQGDLGAESIDFLDIVFRLEREFGFKIPRGELFPESIFQGDPDFIKNGVVTEAGMEELRRRLPAADLIKFEMNPHVVNISDLFTVGMIVRYIADKLQREETRSLVERKVEEMLSEMFLVHSSQIGPRTRLCSDFGATEFDLLSIAFQLQTQLGVTLSRDELFPPELFRPAPKYIHDGKIDWDWLEHDLPFVNSAMLRGHPSGSVLTDLITVEMIVRFIEAKLSEAKGGVRS